MSSKENDNNLTIRQVKESFEAKGGDETTLDVNNQFTNNRLNYHILKKSIVSSLISIVIIISFLPLLQIDSMGLLLSGDPTFLMSNFIFLVVSIVLSYYFLNSKNKESEKGPLEKKSHSNRTPYFALLVFLIPFILSIIFITLPYLGVDEISILGIVLLSRTDYKNFIDAIVTTQTIDNFWNQYPLIFVFIIIAIIVIISVVVKFLLLFKPPKSEYDDEVGDNSIKFFNITKIKDRVRYIFIRPSNDNRERIVNDATGSICSYSTTESKHTNAVLFVPDKRNVDSKNFFIELPECFDISNIRNYSSEISWISLANNLSTIITVIILFVGTLLNIVLNIITQAQLDPYLIMGPFSWISLSSIVSICIILIWALREIKGDYAVFRIIKVDKSPLDLDRYLVLPYYYLGISGTDINDIMSTYLTFNNEKKSDSNLLPAIIEDRAVSEENDEDVDDMSFTSSLQSIEVDLNNDHTVEYLEEQLASLKSRNKELELQNERNLLLVKQFSEDNANLKKQIRLRKSLDYSTQRSFVSLDVSTPDRSSRLPDHSDFQNNISPDKRSNNNILIMIVIFAFISIIGIYWASTIFSATNFLVLLVAILVVIIIVGVLFGLLAFRHYMYESGSASAPRNVNIRNI